MTKTQQRKRQIPKLSHRPKRQRSKRVKNMLGETLVTSGGTNKADLLVHRPGEELPRWLHNVFNATSIAKKDIGLRLLWDQLVEAHAAARKAERNAYFEGATSAFKEAAELLEKAGIQAWPYYFRSRCPGGFPLIATEKDAAT
jgi:hypothetical protein